MSVNKKNRSLWGSRSEAQRIYYQRQTINRLEKEIEQLKEQRQELRSWLEEALNELKQNDVYDRTSYEMGQIIATECIIEKLNKLEGKNERKSK